MGTRVDGVAHHVGLQAHRGGDGVFLGGNDEADLVPSLLEHTADEQDALGLVVNLLQHE